MQTPDTLHEVTPLSEKDCFYITERYKNNFDYPIHIHPEYELNYIENAKGAIQQVGNSTEEIEQYDLVFITGSNLEHVWKNGEHEHNHIREITIQFHPTMFIESFIEKRQFRPIRDMFLMAQQHGISFPQHTIVRVLPMLEEIKTEKNGFSAVIKLLSLLYELSLSDDIKRLSTPSLTDSNENDDDKIFKITTYIRNNFRNKITLEQLAIVSEMDKNSLSRFIRLSTGRSFSDYILDIRLEHVASYLSETNHSISEICYLCGFNNLSNFNRLFKKRKGVSPKEYRDKFLNT